MPPKALGPLALRKAASEGDGAAQYTIALRYLEGKGTERDLKKASEWLDRAARTGLAPAQYRLAERRRREGHPQGPGLVHGRGGAGQRQSHA